MILKIMPLYFLVYKDNSSTSLNVFDCIFFLSLLTTWPCSFSNSRNSLNSFFTAIIVENSPSFLMELSTFCPIKYFSGMRYSKPVLCIHIHYLEIYYSMLNEVIPAFIILHLIQKPLTLTHFPPKLYKCKIIKESY